MQLAVPRLVAMAVRMAMTVWMMNFHVSFFIVVCVRWLNMCVWLGDKRWGTIGPVRLIVGHVVVASSTTSVATTASVAAVATVAA